MKLDNYLTRLENLERKGRRRNLALANGLDFSSNDYLGLATHPDIKAAVEAALQRGVPLGATGSRLLRGNHAEHEALEAEAAAHFSAPRMIYFGSGYMANLAALSTLPQPGDLIVYDELIHASAHAGIRAGRAEAVSARHNDAQAFEDRIRAWREGGGRGTPWIVVESIYSMDGDQAPLKALHTIATRYDGVLYIDEAHATGVYGANGGGFAATLGDAENIVTLHTCGKALGGSGALLGAHATLCDYLVNRASGFVFTTAPSPLQAAALREALRILRDQPERRARLFSRISHANERIATALGQPVSGTQIIPIIVGDNERAVRLAAQMQAQGFDIRAIRPPTVPHGTARLRISITLNVGLADIDRMVETLSHATFREAA
ncbi:8-amino-7-oxononanoate synthase [Brucella sp. 458]|uniref:8-amino-7-oxononanoate synthase n=1 Tax=Brucella sp. 458 TaxID=2821140 RepID=UPI001ADFD1EB|nr:8-amino-7-oxononanoate synthase [Brucella sp. 458]QTN99611.1 8-amino-7-oxononanoate synthase [Brucella sp. 458]